MKTLHTIYTSFAKRAAIILTLLLTFGVTSAWAETSTFTWGTNPSAYTSSSSNFSEGQVTFTGTKGTGSTPTRAWSDGLRMYAGGTAQFSVPNGYVITKIEGYTTFNFNDATGQQTVLFTGLSKATCNTDVTVTYQSSGYTITYNTNGGSTIASTTGTKLPNPLPTPTKTGYTFAGWFTNSNLTTAAVAGATISSNTTLYAKWTANKYTVKFNGNGNTGGSMNDQSFTYGTAQNLTPNAFEKYGYNFAGWAKTSNGSVAYTDGQSVSNLTSTNNATVNLYAKWTEKALTNYRTTCTEPSTFTVTYNANDATSGSVPEDNTEYAKDAQVTVSGNTGNLAKTGYTFSGWNTKADGTGTTYAEGDKFTITENTTLYAQWTAKTATSLSWSAATYSATIDVDNTFPTLTKSPDDLSPIAYSSSNTGVATIDANTGDITLVAAGTTTIKATFTETATHTGATASYTLTVNPSNCKWVETEIGDIESGDEVVVTMTSAVGVTYALPSDKSTGSNPQSVIVEVIDGNCLKDVQSSMVWIINKEDDNLTFESLNHAGYFLDCTNDNAGVRVSNGTNRNRNFVIDPTSGYLKNTQTTDARYLGVHNTNYYWYCYTTYGNNTGGQILKFYKKECLDSETFWVDYNLANVTCTTAPPHSQIAKNETLALNFEAATGYALPDNVTVTGATPSWNKATGTLTISNPTANVTITIEALKLHTINWMVGSSSVLSENVANGTGVTQTPASNPEGDVIGDCADTFLGWSEKSAGSTPQDAAYYDDLCTAAQMKSKHSSVTGDKTFYAVFASGEETPGQPVDASLSFANTAQRTSWSKSQQVWTQNGVTLTNNRGSGSEIADNSNPARFYKNSEIIVEHTSSKITKIVFDCNTNAYATDLNSSIGSISGATVSLSSDKVTVAFTNAVTSFTVTLSSGQVRMDALTVTAGGGTITTYSNYVTNCCATPVPTNGSYTSPNGTSVTLTWDGESTQYHITGNGLDVDTKEESYTVTGLTECNEYTFYVSAYPEGGCESEAIAITAQPFSGSKTVTFNYNGNGQANTTSSTSCGNTSITLPTPTWAGYRFMGWYTAANGGEKVNENPYTPTSDIPLYAQWEKEYNVTYNANGGSTTCAGGAYIAGETVIVCTTNPSRTGHTFTGWTYSPNVTITDGKFVMPASDVTITAQWQVNSYTVTWNPNGGNWGGSTDNIVETYEYGAAIVQPAAPQRDGYRFTGWSPAVSATMSAGNKTYTAQWKQNYTITFHDGSDVTPWTQTKDAESINLTEYVGTLACDDYQFAGWSTDATKYDDEPANITTWVTGNYTPTANIDLYAVYTKGAVTNDFTLNCAGGMYEIWEKGHNQHMAGRQNGGGDKFYTTEYWDANNSESNGAPFTITKVADNTYTLQNADGQYITRHSYNEDKLAIEETLENADRYKWTISNGTNGTWRFTNKAATSYALVYYNNRYFELRSASSVTAGNTTTYDLELTPAQTNVYQSNPNCGPYHIIFNTHGGEFIQGEYAYGEEQTGLTETTYSKFPAAELEGYTFAGWKDGSPIDDEITADNASDAPYLKQAGEDLVVSSNKTYHAVYYYYDEEEDIDWSKEFTTSIYAEVNGMKYFLAGTPSSGTMSSTTDCGYVSEVTITPGTGANAGKYKITVNGVAMAPKANETDLLNGTYWWTITERSVGSGEYKISGQDKKNIVLFNSSWGHYTYNQGSEYGNNYYYPRFGKCIQHHWTSNPTLKPSLNLSGEVYVTATNARGIMATSTLKVSAKQLNANEKVNITSNSNDVYFSADRTVNFVKANKPTNTLTITASPSGVIEQDIYVHYKPSTEGNGTPASVVVSANLATPNPSVTDDQTIHVRNMPAKFVIATKVGATWYALPADMSSATNPLGVAIEVDETTMTTIAPNTTTYTLWPVKTTATENDRYTNVTGAAYGDRVRFAAVNYEQRGLWANDNNNGSTIRDYAKIDALGADALAAYEWKVTTTVVDGHWQYTLQTDQDKNQNFLRYWTSAEGGAKWGTYESGENTLYLLPMTEITEMNVEVMEWGTNSMALRFEGDAPANVDITLGGTTKNVPLTNLNSSDIYKVEGVALTTNDGEVLKIVDNTSNNIKLLCKPILVTGESVSTAYSTLETTVCDVVVLNGGKLSAGDAHVDFANIYVYPGGKLILDGKSLGVKRQVYLRGGYSWLNSEYALPELYLNGTIDFNGSGNIIYDYYIQNYKYYQFALPYDVQLAKVTDEAGIDNFPVWVKHYNGALRAVDPHATSWEWYPSENGDANAYFKAGEGYIIAAQPRQVGNTANRPLSIIRFPLGNKVFNKTNGLETDRTITTTAHGINGYKAGTVTANNVGWNFIGNPFMSTWQGDIGYKQLTKHPNEANWDGTYDWVDADIKYITIMSAESGSDYAQYIASKTELKPFFPFYLQETAEGGTGTINFAAANRIQKAPAMLSAETPREAFVQIEITAEGNTDQTGMFIGDRYSDDIDFDDYEKMFGSSTDKPKVWLMHEDKRMAFEAMTESKAAAYTAIGYRAPQTGKYMFAINEEVSKLSDVEAVYLTDNQTGVTDFDLLSSAYEFESNGELYNDSRFTIRIVLRDESPGTTMGVGNLLHFNSEQPMKFIYQDKMYILQNGVIYDAMGKQVKTINK